MEDKKPSIRLFRTKHPFVTNKDGSKSNVKLSTFSFGEGDKTMHLVIPTMVGGKQLTSDQAVEVAKKIGLDSYPKFKTQKEADSYAKQIHGSINEQGFLLK